MRKEEMWRVAAEQRLGGNERLAQGEVEVRRIRKEYFEYLYNIDTQEQDAVHM